jgi:hypothetical protein
MVKTGDKVLVIGEDSTVYTIADKRLQTRNRVALTHPLGFKTRRSVYSLRALSAAELQLVSKVNRMISGSV